MVTAAPAHAHPGPPRHPAQRSEVDARQLAADNLGLCHAFARDLAARRPEVVRSLGGVQDVAQIAALALIRAGELWDSSRDARFSTYAHYWMRQLVFRTARTSATIRLPDWLRGDERDEAAARTRCERFGQDEDGCLIEPQGRPGDDPAEADERKHRAARVRATLRALPPRLRRVLRWYFWADGSGHAGGLTLAKIGERLGVTRSRAQQLLADALDRLRQTLPPELWPTGAAKSAQPAAAAR
jgi:RNA polymerase sigma factor (sigma-70 family)